MPLLSDSMDLEQKKNKIRYIIKILRDSNLIENTGGNKKSLWFKK